MTKLNKITKQDLTMPVVILCGGSGSRIREETLTKPKPMVEVGGLPILWHLMKIYAHYGFKNFIITLGHKGDYIREYFKNHSYLFSKFNIKLVETGEGTQPGGRVLLCSKYITTDLFMCTYGDGLSDINLHDVVAYHKLHKNSIGTLSGTYVPHKFGIITFDEGGMLNSYQKGHTMENPINMGFMVLTKPFLKYLKPDQDIEYPFQTLADKKALSVYHHKGYFGAVDTYKDLEDLNKLWDNGAPWKVWKDKL